MIELLNIDCMEYMATCKDKQFDLAIVDPPYGLPERSGHGAGKLQNRIIQTMHQRGWDIAPEQLYFKELFRISSHQIIWGGNYFDLPPTRGFIIWDKEQPFENFSACEFAWTSFDRPAKIFKEPILLEPEKIRSTLRRNLLSFINGYLPTMPLLT
jgi:site-specific DNA-methyltransferase (adenine-specific)